MASTQIIFELKNASTLEVEETFEACNVILMKDGLQHIRTSKEDEVPFLGKDFWNTHNPGNAFHSRLFLSIHDYAANAATYRYTALHLHGADATVQNWAYVDATPPYWEATYRFNVPATQREWKGATLAGGLTYLRITPACIQSSSQVLDVKYRIFRAEAHIDSESTDMEYAAAVHYFRNFTQGLVTTSDNSYEALASPFTLGYRPQNWFSTTDEGFFSNLNTQSRDSETYDVKQGRRTQAFTVGKTDMVGIIHNSLRVAGSTNTQSFSRHDMQHTDNVSTVHHHSGLSNKPYEDIDNLSSSGGLPVVVNPRTVKKLPDFIQIHHTTSGQVGTSRYLLRHQHTLGYPGNNYNRTTRLASVNMGFAEDFPELSALPYPTNDAHGCLNHGFAVNKVEFSPEQWISYSKTALTVTDFLDDVSIDFDAAHFGFTPTNIVSVSVDHALDIIYIGCSTTGVWKIEDPMGAPVVQNFTSALNAIQAGGVMHLDVGYNSRVWAFFDGDLMYTDNQGGFWASNNAVNGRFSFSGLTSAGQWTRCRDMVCDRVDPNHVVGLVLDHNHPLVTRLKVLFYHFTPLPKSYVMSTDDFHQAYNDRNTSTLLFSDGFGGFSTHGTNNYRKGMLNVSKRHSVWTMTASVVADQTQSNMDTINAYTGDTGLHLNPLYTVGGTPVGFMYDNFDTPVFLSGALGTSHVCKANRSLMADNDFSSIRPSLRHNFQLVNSESNRDYKSLVYNAYIGGIKTTTEQEALVDSLSFMDKGDTAYGVKDSLFEDLAWSEFVWDGSVFVNKAVWMEDAIDSTGTRNGIRKNFRAGSLMFSGRQYLDVTGNAPTGGTGTFIATITPAAKVDQSFDPNHTLFDMQFDIQEAITLNIRENAVRKLHVKSQYGESFLGSATLADGVQYRIMMVLNGTSLKVYLNGVLDIDESIVLAPIFGGTDYISVGARTKMEEYWTHLPHPDSFVSGEILNVQVWDAALTQADATADALLPLGLVVPAVAATTDITGNFAMTDIIVEDHLSHIASEAMIYGLDVAFTEAATGQSFTEGDFHTLTACEGLLSDNTNSFDYALASYIHPTTRKYSVLNDQPNPTVVPAGVVTISGAKLQLGTDPFAIAALNGVAVTTSPGVGAAQYGRVTSYDRFDGEISFEFQIQHEDSLASIGFCSSPVTVSAETELIYSIRSRTDGTIDVYEDGIQVSSGIANYTVDSIFRMHRLPAGTFEFSSINPISGDVTLLHESTITHIYGGSAFIGVITWGKCSGFCEIRYTATMRPGVCYIGSFTNSTGMYSDKFTATSNREEDLRIRIDAVDIAVVIEDFDSVAPPMALTAGQARYYPNSGLVEFSTADFGKDLEFYTDAIYYPG